MGLDSKKDDGQQLARRKRRERRNCLFVLSGCCISKSTVDSSICSGSSNLGHLTSKSDVYSFGVVLLEMLIGRRSMDKNRPSGEHHLVEWARPHLGERRRFYRIIDPRLEGNFSIKGAQKAAQLAYNCLSRDPKARPLMSGVVEILKPLLNLKDMASSSPFFQAMQAEKAAANKNSQNGRNGSKPQISFGRNGQQQMRNLPNGVRSSLHHPTGEG